MKKLLVLAVAVLLVGVAGNAMAYEGDFEMSGHINTGLGWQYNGKAFISGQSGAFTEEGMVPVDFNVSATTLKRTNNTTWLFYVGDVELDIAKTFGENIRLRTDLDFLRVGSNGFYNGFQLNQMIEQAYATVNIPVGYGLEFLVGRFNAPMGFEAVDNNDNDLPFHTLVYNFLRPQNLTGIKFYYPFSDLVDLHVWVANNLRDVQAEVNQNGPLPAFGLRLGFTWGAEGQESTLGISGAGSSEAGHKNAVVAVYDNDKWGDWSYLGDVDFNVWVNDVFAIGGEAIFRIDDAAKAWKNAGFAKTKAYYYGGLLNMHYVFSDVWDGTLRYTFVRDARGYSSLATVDFLAAASQYHRYAAASALGWTASFHQIDLGINYHITDGAKLMTMYRFEMERPDKAGAATRTYANLLKQGYDHTVAANFAYEF